MGWQAHLIAAHFVPLSKGGKQPENIRTMIDRLAGAQEVDLLGIAWVIGGSVFKQAAERDWFRRRFAMFQDILEESWVYQEMKQEFFEEGIEKGLEKGLAKGLEKGREEGRAQGQREAIMSFLQLRFPETLALANQQTNSINDPQVLQTVLTKLFAAQTVEEARQILLDINKH